MSVVEDTGDKLARPLANISVIVLGVGCGLVVWLVSAAYDHYVLGLGTFIECLFNSTDSSMTVRYASIAIGVAAGVTGQVMVGRMVGKRRLQVLFEQANDGLILIDRSSGRILEANRRASDLLGYTQEELKNLTMAALHPHDYPVARAFIERVLSHGSGISDEVSCYTKDGTVMPAELSASVVQVGQRFHILVSVRDISDRRRAEAAMQRALEELRVANRTKTEFLANVSHELRTPLNAILGFSEIIASGQLGPSGNPTYRQYAADIHASGRHLLDIVNDLLDLTKVERGTEELHEEPVDPTAICRGMARMVEERARRAGVKLTLDLPASLPGLRADPRKLKQILGNLLSNAIKFTPGGGQVMLSCGYAAGRGHWMAVQDTGIGIAEADIERALAPFQQVDGRLARNYEGLGIGLALTKSFVELHEGKLEIRSELGQGTQVIASFPEARALAPTQSVAAAPAAAEVPGVRAVGSGRPDL